VRALGLLAVGAVGALWGCQTPAQPGVLGQLRPVAQAEAPPGNLTLKVTPSDARVEVDGVPQGLAQDFDGEHGALQLTGGAHRLTLRRDGYAPLELTVYGEGDGKQRLSLQLEKQ
jgi:hypothetical protein